MRYAEGRTPNRELRRLVAAAAVLAALNAAACGKKGPPLAPLNLVPDRPPTLTGRVVDGTVYLQTTIPAKNANGPGTVDIDHLDLFAVTVAPGSQSPPDRELAKPSHQVGRIAVKPPPDPDAEVDESQPPPKDDRPGPGETVAFSEKLTPHVMEPVIVPAAVEPRTPYVLEVPAADTPTSPDAVPAGGGAVAATAGLPAGPPNGIDAAFVTELPQTGALTPPGTPAGAVPAAPPVSPFKVTSRIYTARGFSRKGRPGASSPRVVVPLVTPPPAPSKLTVTFAETAITIAWTAADVPSTPAPAAGAEPAAPFKYNVYDANAGAPPKPLNSPPLDAATFVKPGLDVGVEQCFVVRSVRVTGDVTLESAASTPECVTPRDIFPPAAPKALAAVAGAGAINLIWDANTEPDLAGYLVLRGDAPDGTLQPLTPEPIRETRYADATARAGSQYVYVVVAVDKSGNRSANSNRVTETGR